MPRASPPPTQRLWLITEGILIAATGLVAILWVIDPTGNRYEPMLAVLGSLALAFPYMHRQRPDLLERFVGVVDRTRRLPRWLAILIAVGVVGWTIWPYIAPQVAGFLPLVSKFLGTGLAAQLSVLSDLFALVGTLYLITVGALKVLRKLNVLPAQPRLNAPLTNMHEFRLYLQRLSERLQRETHADGAFDLRVQLDAQRACSPAELLDYMLQRRLVLLQAEGGAGKSTMMARTCAQALSPTYMHAGTPFFLELKAGEESTQTKQANFDEVAFEALFKRGSSPGSYQLFVQILRPDERAVLFLDGLERLNPALAGALLLYLRNLTANFPGLSVIASDRLASRNEYIANYSAVTMAELLPSEIDRHLGGEAASPKERRLLSSPFFLDMWIRTKSKGRREMFERYLTLSGVRETELPTLARVAFDAFVHSHGAPVGRAWLEGRLDMDLLARLMKAGVAQEDPARKEIRARHQLIQDFLVGLYLSSREVPWNEETFDQASLYGTAFESLSFAAELLGDDRDRLDDFLLCVYDWSYYAVFRCLADAYARVAEPFIRGDLPFAFAALYAEKCFDIFLRTSEQARNNLGILPDEVAADLRKARTFEELAEAVRNAQLETERGKRWRALFLMDSAELIPDHHALLVSDPLMGWTAANVFRRLPLTSDSVATIRGQYDYRMQEPSHCWRVVHVLGRFPTRKNVEALIAWLKSATDYPTRWIRYGAIRSLMEVAARNVDERPSVISALSNNLEFLSMDGLCMRSLREHVLLRDDSTIPDAKGWYQAALPLLRAAAAAPAARNAAPAWAEMLGKVEQRAMALVN